MKTLYIIGFTMVLFTACIDQQKKLKLTDFKANETTEYQEQDGPFDPAMKRAKKAWESTKSICGNVVWY